MRLHKIFFGLVLSCSVLVVMPRAAVAQSLLINEAGTAYDEGVELLKQEKYEEAFARFSTATELNDIYAEAFFGKAEALRHLEDFEAALQSYSHAINLDEHMAAAYNGRGICYKELNDFQGALTDFQKAFEFDRGNPEISANLGDMLINHLGISKRALKILVLANRLDPKNAEVLRNLGWARALFNEHDEAIVDLEKSIELDPQEYKTHFALARIHIAQEDYQLAVESIGLAIETYEPEEEGEPDVFIHGYLERADARGKLADMDDTAKDDLPAIFQAIIKDCDAVLEELPESGLAFYRRGAALRMLGRYSEAIKSLTDAIQLAPVGEEASYLAEAYLKRGICWHNQKEEGLARRDFDQASAVNYEDPRSYLWVGITYAQEKEYRRAIEYYSKSIAKSPSFVMAHVNKGLAYFQLEEYEKAVESFNEAIANEPNESEHYYNRGFTYRVMDDLDKALASFELAILNDPTSAKSFRDGAAVLREMGRSELAGEWDKKARQINAEAT